MSRGKKEPAIPFATSVEVEAGRGKTVANGGQEDRCDGADVPHGGLRIDHGQAAHRTVAAALQHDPTAQCLGIPAPGASRRGSPVRSHGVRLSKRTGLVYWRAKS